MGSHLSLANIYTAEFVKKSCDSSTTIAKIEVTFFGQEIGCGKLGFNLGTGLKGESSVFQLTTKLQPRHRVLHATKAFMVISVAQIW